MNEFINKRNVIIEENYFWTKENNLIQIKAVREK